MGPVRKTPGRKNARESESSSGGAPAAPAAAAAASKGKKGSEAPFKGGKNGATGGKKGTAKEKEPDDGLLRVKTVQRKVQPKQGTKEATKSINDKAFNDDFNALKIVRPTLVPMTKQKGKRLGWNENDKDEELERLIREDQDREEHPEDWGGQAKETGIFIVEHVSMVRKNRPAPRETALDGKYAGRDNFKKFRVGLFPLVGLSLIDPWLTSFPTRACRARTRTPQPDHAPFASRSSTRSTNPPTLVSAEVIPSSLLPFPIFTTDTRL